MKQTTVAVTGGLVRAHPALKELVCEASHATRLEELALCCHTLNRELVPANSATRADYARQAREAAEEMAVFARVMEATRANLYVMKRLRELRAGRLEYGEAQVQPAAGMECGDGNH